MKNKKFKNLLFIFFFALLIRLLFDFYFQQFYFGKFIFQYKDSATYINPILNLINHGTYTIYLNVEDAKYFRPPVYPSFLGLIYFIFGEKYFNFGVAIFQSIIDSFSTIFVYLIIYRLFKNIRLALVTSLIYATYPFVIVWNPISYTEILQIFLMFCLVYITLLNNSYKKIFIQGLLITLSTLTKQYLGLLIFIPLISYFFDKKLNYQAKIKALTFFIFVFSFTMSPWVIRNYIVSNGQIIILKGNSTGLPIYGKDFEAFEKFANLFNQNITPIWDAMSFKDEIKLGKKHLKFTKKHTKEIEEAFNLAYKCGPSFVKRRKINYKQEEFCEKEVIIRFNSLTKKFWNETPFFEAMETRFDSLEKIFTKIGIVNKNIQFSKKYFIKKFLFIYRIILIILGFLSIIYIIIFSNNEYKNVILSIFISAWSLYFFFSFMIVHTEIRYLLVPDILFTIFAPYIFFSRNPYEKN